jgi:hypothetical protein
MSNEEDNIKDTSSFFDEPPAATSTATKTTTTTTTTPPYSSSIINNDIPTTSAFGNWLSKSSDSGNTQRKRKGEDIPSTTNTNNPSPSKRQKSSSPSAAGTADDVIDLTGDDDDDDDEPVVQQQQQNPTTSKNTMVRGFTMPTLPRQEQQQQQIPGQNQKKKKQTKMKQMIDRYRSIYQKKNNPASPSSSSFQGFTRKLANSITDARTKQAGNAPSKNGNGSSTEANDPTKEIAEKEDAEWSTSPNVADKERSPVKPSVAAVELQEKVSVFASASTMKVATVTQPDNTNTAPSISNLYLDASKKSVCKTPAGKLKRDSCCRDKIENPKFAHKNYRSFSKKSFPMEWKVSISNGTKKSNGAYR